MITQAAANRQGGNMSDMDRDERRARVSAYVRDRLRAEARARGVVAKIAKATNFTPAHISNVKNGKVGVGDDFVRAIATYWKTDAAALESEAIQRPASDRRAPASGDPARTAVRGSKEYESASEAVRSAFDSIIASEPMSVVGWARELDRLIEWERRGWLSAPPPVQPQQSPDRANPVRRPKA